MILEEQTSSFGAKLFSFSQKDKEDLFLRIVGELNDHHIKSCESFKRMVTFQNKADKTITKVSDFPFIPVRMFKERDLYSVNSSQIIRTMSSSGTTGQKVSKIFLDSYTANTQKKVLTQIMTNFFSNKRKPMLVIDSRATVHDRTVFSARKAAILGFSIFGTDVTYALTSDMEIDFDTVNKFLEKHQNEEIFVFGFTFVIWKYFYQALMKSGKKIDLSRGSLLHGGGWKKLVDEKVEREVFKQKLKVLTGIESCHDYYGMVEQTGSIFVECEYGYLHASIYSDVITRDPVDFSVCAPERPGLLQLISLIPYSYPGHSILSEDVGVIHGVDDCKCGRLGNYFTVLGRIANAEVRGCGDTRS